MYFLLFFQTYFWPFKIVKIIFNKFFQFFENFPNVQYFLKFKKLKISSVQPLFNPCLFFMAQTQNSTKFNFKKSSQTFYQRNPPYCFHISHLYSLNPNCNQKFSYFHFRKPSKKNQFKSKKREQKWIPTSNLHHTMIKVLTATSSASASWESPWRFHSENAI